MHILPPEPRIVVIGTSSAGKTTLADALAQGLRVARIELDELFWAPEWQPKPPGQFAELVRDAAAAQAWVADGNYRAVRPVLWARANVVVWLNYSLPVVLWRGVTRAVRRSWRGDVLWHGNRESFRRTFLSSESILLWILTTHRRKSREFAQLRHDPGCAHLLWLEFRRPADTSMWLREVTRAS